jgi:hypothetical protein
MKFDELLTHRDELLKAARLANLAYAYQWLGNFADRINRAGLQGQVVLYGPHPDGNLQEPMLAAKEFSQSVIDEHFLQEEVTELYAIFRCVHDSSLIREAKFRLEDLGEIYLPALRRVLELAEALPRKQRSTVGDADFDAA